VVDYLYPTIISASQDPPNSAGGEFLDHFTSTFQPSLLTQIIEGEAAADRATQRSQLQQVLLRTLIKFDVESQRLLKMYYGQELTQQEIAKQLAMKQCTVSRRLTNVRQSLLQTLSQWSQSVLHQSLDTNVVNNMSITIEEWLSVHYGTPDP
jgi:RNA polymerase sigma factor (sigma-70 family)